MEAHGFTWTKKDPQSSLNYLNEILDANHTVVLERKMPVIKFHKKKTKQTKPFWH